MGRAAATALVILSVLVIVFPRAPRPTAQEIPTAGLDFSRQGDVSVSPASGTPAPWTGASDANRSQTPGTAPYPPGTATGAPPSSTPTLPAVAGRSSSPATTQAAVTGRHSSPAPSRIAQKAAKSARTASPAPKRRSVPSVRPRAATGGLRGGASYYGTGGPGKYAAMHEFRDGDRLVVVVTAFHDGRTWSVTVPVVTQCGICRWQSGATLIDLSVPAWLDLGYPLSKGIAPVQVQIIEGGLG